MADFTYLNVTIRKVMRQKLRIFNLIVLAFSLINCTSIGTRLLPKNREGFNSAMIVSEEQQLLLNLVRIQFEDRPYFVSVDSITTSNNISASSSASYSYSNSPSGSTNDNLSVFRDILELTSESISKSFSVSQSFNLSPNLSYSDSPTVSFTPLQGEKFTRQTLTPLTIDELYLLIATGWSPQRVFRTIVEELSEMDNVSVLSRAEIPEYKKFAAFTKLLAELDTKKMIYFHKGVITHVSEDPYNPDTAPEERYPGHRFKKSAPKLPAISAQNEDRLSKLKTDSKGSAQ